MQGDNICLQLFKMLVQSKSGGHPTTQKKTGHLDYTEPYNTKVYTILSFLLYHVKTKIIKNHLG